MDQVPVSTGVLPQWAPPPMGPRAHPNPPPPLCPEEGAAKAKKHDLARVSALQVPTGLSRRSQASHTTRGHHTHKYVMVVATLSHFFQTSKVWRYEKRKCESIFWAGTLLKL